MQRWVCGVSYLGTEFHGWQKQPSLKNTVEQLVEEAIASVADHSVDLVCSGRTDAGVHALDQVIHFDSDAERSSANWLLGVNRMLPASIKLQWVQPVDSAFHARYAAVRRRYAYVIHNSAVSHPLWSNRVVWFPRSLRHIDAMIEGAQAWVGEHDFSSFRDRDCQAHHPVRTITEFSLVRRGDFCVFYCEGNAFLHHMVRNMMGVLIEIGLGRRPVEWAAEVLEARSRSAAAMTAAPDGLYLARVSYGSPWHAQIPAAQNLMTAFTGGY